MTNKEAIKDIKENIKPCCGGKSLDMAIEALEKQIPKEPFETYTCLNKHFECSVCGVRLSRHSSSRYCMTCGQKIDWEEVEE